MDELCLVFWSVVGNKFVLISTEVPDNSCRKQLMDKPSGDDVIRFITKS